MTTIIGIAGRDPETLEAYVVIGADTRGTSMRGSAPVDDDKKLFGNQSANYVIGTAGKVLSDFFPEDSLFNQFLNNPKNESYFNIESTLEEINEHVESRERTTNAYLVSLKNNEPCLYYLYNDGLVDAGAYKVIGSGNLFSSNLNSLRANHDKRVHISKKEAIKTILKIMNEVAKKDTYTGGHLDVAIVTESSILMKRNYAEIENSVKNPGLVLYNGMNIEDAFTHPHHRELD